MLEHTANPPNLLKFVVTCDETWNFTNDPESKCRLMQWKSPGSQKIQKSPHVGIKIQVKSCLKGIHFTSTEEVQAKTENFLKGLPKTLF
ncbi:hypothetical protein TNCV_1076171 [Trichonephila clavipes]|nr:hypothetical protein TNCV_1076171 [Trichonephila clavipes]